MKQEVGGVPRRACNNTITQNHIKLSYVRELDTPHSREAIPASGMAAASADGSIHAVPSIGSDLKLYVRANLVACKEP